MSHIKRKPFFFAHAKPKMQISFAVSSYTSGTILLLHKSEFQASRHILQLYSPVCVGPGQKPLRPVFSQRGSYCRGHFLHVASFFFHFALVPKIMKK